jgi:hypothetical protein
MVVESAALNVVFQTLSVVSISLSESETTHLYHVFDVPLLAQVQVSQAHVNSSLYLFNIMTDRYFAHS